MEVDTFMLKSTSATRGRFTVTLMHATGSISSQDSWIFLQGFSDNKMQGQQGPQQQANRK